MADWKRPGADAHKRTCGSAGALDIDVPVMATTQLLVPTGTGEVIPMSNFSCISHATGQVMDQPLTPVAGTFKVKVQVPLRHTGSQRAKTIMPVKIQDQQGRHLLLGSDGPGEAASATLETRPRSTWPPAGFPRRGTGGEIPPCSG